MSTKLFFLLENRLYELDSVKKTNVESLKDDFFNRIEHIAIEKIPMTVKMNFDASKESDRELYKAFNRNEILSWFVGFPDGNEEIDFDSAGLIVLPSCRTFAFFHGIISEIDININLDNAVANFTVNRMSRIKLFPKIANK